MANHASPGSPLAPTFRGYISTTMDALILFEACLTGQLTHIARRPQDRERAQLIRSGNIFIYEEHSSGIKRWTDGVPWSPSRILNNFLLYRELDKPFQPGEKKRAMKRNRNEGVAKSTAKSKANSPGAFRTGSLVSPTTMSSGMLSGTNAADADRPYIGSLVDSYQFKENGLVKKTISVQHQGVTHHLVSYYNLDDIKSGVLKRVKASPEMQNIAPRQSLLSSANFRAPVDDDNELEVIDPSSYSGFMYAPPTMDLLNNMQRPQMVPSGQHYRYPNSYSTPSHYGPNSAYMGLPPTMSQPPSTTYSHPQQYYPVDPSYGTSPQPSYAVVPPSRGHPVVVGTNNTNHTGYPGNTTPILGNGGNLTPHPMPSPYMNGDMFHGSAPDPVAEGAPAGSVGNYGAAGGITPNNSSHHELESSAQRGAVRLDGHLSNGFDPGMSRLNEHDFGGTLQESPGQHFGATGTSTTSPNYGLGMNHAGMPSPETEWEALPPNHFHKRSPGEGSW
ncbi:Gti1/Pac2 family-domain-containing protein [Xylaria intraflava]|nr:Gti1/Pac2 family-domain-containing protein [Xylaria intraflava]